MFDEIHESRIEEWSVVCVVDAYTRIEFGALYISVKFGAYYA